MFITSFFVWILFQGVYKKCFVNAVFPEFFYARADYMSIAFQPEEPFGWL